MTEPRTAAGRLLYEDVRIHNIAQRVRADDRHDERWLSRVRAIEAEARAAACADIRSAVEGLITETGGRCSLPSDYEPDELNVCETHSELLFDMECEDQPRQLLAVLAAIDKVAAP